MVGMVVGVVVGMVVSVVVVLLVVSATCTHAHLPHESNGPMVLTLHGFPVVLQTRLSFVELGLPLVLHVLRDLAVLHHEILL